MCIFVGLHLVTFLFDQAEENTVSTLAFLNPGVIVPCLISQAKSILANPALFQVTNDDYGIFLTPDGELYDKAILER